MSHHWKGLKPNPVKYFGFTYKITEKTTKKFYIGKKQYWISNGRVKKTSLRPNMADDIWKPIHWKQSTWKSYTGSSVELNAAVKDNPKNFEYQIIGQYTCKADLYYGEVKSQILLDVMVARDSNGERSSFNKQVAAVKFMPPWKEREEL